MDTGPISRAVAPLVVYVGPPQPSGATELATPQAVAPVDDSESTSASDQRRLPAGNAPAQQPPNQVGFTLDPQSLEIVFRIADRQSGDVVFQLPSDEALRFRAYEEQQSRAKAEHVQTPAGAITAVKA